MGINKEYDLIQQECWEIRRKRFGIPKHETLLYMINDCIMQFEKQCQNESWRSLHDELRRIMQPLDESYTIEELVSDCQLGNLDDRINCIREVHRNFINLCKRLSNQNKLSQKLPADLAKAIRFLNVVITRLFCGLELMESDWEIIDKAELWGLALSGGGIRSAAFNLGIVQGLKENGTLDHIDYMSTVSGGGYTGSALTYQSTRNLEYPFARPTASHSNANIDWIRKNASYLNPGQGLNIWALVAAFGRGIFINLALLIPLLLGLMWVLTLSGENITSILPFTRIAVVRIDSLLAGGQIEMLVVGATFLGFMLFSLFRIGQERGQQRPLRLKIPMTVWLVFWTAMLSYVSFSNTIEPITDWTLTSLIVLAVAVFVVVMLKLMCERCRMLIDRVLRLSIVMYALELLSWVVTAGVLAILYDHILTMPPEHPPILWISLLAGMALLAKLLTNSIFYAFLSSTPLRLRAAENRYFSIQYGDLLWLGTTLAFIGILPLLYEAANGVNNYVQALPDNAIKSIVAVLGAILSGLGWLLRNKGDERKGIVALFLRFGVSMLILAALLWLYHGALILHTLSEGSEPTVKLWLWLIVWLFGISLIDINYVSMHRYYRNRLMEVFFGATPEHEHRLNQSLSDNLDLLRIDVGVSNTPYQIVNTMLETTGSNQSKYRKRGGASFIFTACHLGSDATGWFGLADSGNVNTNLGTVMAISGAAVDPIIGHTRSQPLRIIMALLNVRLGYWLANPKLKYTVITRLWQESWLSLIGRELIGLPNENSYCLRLTDGGHFENLGLYELVRRKCRHIIVVDAGSDPEWTFSDFARACEIIRVDFAVDIKIDTSKLQPRGVQRRSLSPFVVGRIIYGGGAQEGKLYYIKTTLFDGLPEDILGYARVHKAFPDESTGDQFFSEAQFEAYRELGYMAAKRMCLKLW